MSREFMTVLVIILTAFAAFQWALLQGYAETNDKLRAALERPVPACVAPPIRASWWRV